MPLDRRITIAVIGEGTYNDRGIFEPGDAVAYPVWAELRPVSLERQIESYGVRTGSATTWRVRWQPALDGLADITKATVTDGGVVFIITNLIEDTGRFNEVRRRFMLIDGVHST